MSTVLGPVVGLFVQRQPVKQGRAPLRRYRTDDIVGVPALTVDVDGVIGHPGVGEPILDVHHRLHPASRDRRGTGGISVMATGDHVRLRRRYGDHLVDGAAGCTLLIDEPDGLAGLDLGAGLEVHGAAGVLVLTGVRVAVPCVEFSRFCLGEPASAEVSPAVRTALAELDGGARGYRGAATGPGRIELGDVLHLREPHAPS
ncbi:hypothetical protein [Nakamurella deserti]|uniref:hypothetical protein n=1 Tax=Nakamurella deserti TaxID=2164074 RepID=UPI000DBE5312|nr:hypothetical protein [Nakamurella deserti]